MGIWWVTTIGLLLCLGFVCGTLFHFINGGLDSKDSTRVDPYPVNNDDEENQ